MRSGLVSFFILMMIFSGCRPVTKPVSPEDYFNLSAFMEAEVDKLSRSNFVVEKHIFFNGEEEYKLEEYSFEPGAHPDSLELQRNYWERELQPFFEADINKPSWAGKFESDTIYAEGRVTAIQYSAISDDVRTRSMEIIYDEDGEAYEINATLFSKNSLYQSEQNLTYKRSEGYTINGVQKIRFFDPDEFRIRVAYKEL